MPPALYPESTYQGPAMQSCPRCLAPLKPSARYCFNCGASAADPIDEEREERWIDTTRGLYCPWCGRFNQFHETFRCQGCWESVICLEHKADENIYLCRRCYLAQQEGKPWEDMEETERLRAEETPGDSETRLLHSEPPEGMVLIPAGEFFMGDDAVKTYVKTFAIDPFPVTNFQFQKFLPQHRFHPEKAYHPVVQINWYEAAAYACWAGVRLPTEAEWEKAARGTDRRLYPWGEAFDVSRCNTLESMLKDTTPVDHYPTGRSPYGCYDMAGNIAEWTADWYDPERNFKVIKSCARVDHELLSRCANRAGLEPLHRYGLIGFRCVWER